MTTLEDLDERPLRRRASIYFRVERNISKFQASRCIIILQSDEDFWINVWETHYQILYQMIGFQSSTWILEKICNQNSIYYFWNKRFQKRDIFWKRKHFNLIKRQETYTRTVGSSLKIDANKSYFINIRAFECIIPLIIPISNKKIFFVRWVSKAPIKKLFTIFKRSSCDDQTTIHSKITISGLQMFL